VSWYDALEDCLTLVTRSLTVEIILSRIFSSGTFSNENILSTFTSYRIVPCCRRIPLRRVCAFPDIFLPFVMMSLIGLNSLGIPRCFKLLTIQLQMMW